MYPFCFQLLPVSMLNQLNHILVPALYFTHKTDNDKNNNNLLSLLLRKRANKQNIEVFETIVSRFMNPVYQFNTRYQITINKQHSS